MSNNIRECLEDGLAISGALGVALVEWTTGIVVDSRSIAGYERTEESALGDGEVVLSKVAVLSAVEGMDMIEDVVFTLDSEYHVIRLLRSYPEFFLSMILDRAAANLAMAKIRLAELDELLVIDDIAMNQDSN